MAHDKPLFGDPCNGCGLCCLAGPCGLASALFGQTTGRCRALVDDGLGGFSCGLIGRAADVPYLKEAVVIAIGSGIGCDMIETDDDLAARPARIEAMKAAARAARQAASEEAEFVLRRLGLAPP
jgi:hypothetical protein